MVRGVISGVLVVFALAVLCEPATALQKVQAKTKGAKWDYKVVDENDKKVEEGVFFARGLVLFNRFNERIGTYEDVSETEVKADISKGKLKGKFVLTRKDASALTWKGELERGSGRKYKMTVSFEKIK
jgi:hypothetical protein